MTVPRPEAVGETSGTQPASPTVAGQGKEFTHKGIDVPTGPHD